MGNEEHTSSQVGENTPGGSKDDWLKKRIASAESRSPIPQTISEHIETVVRTKLTKGPLSAGEIGKIAQELLLMLDSENVDDSR